MRYHTSCCRILIVFAVLSAAATADAQDFRIESRVFFHRGDEPNLVNENLTLFHNNLVYDFMGTEGDITILDTARSRLFVLDPQRKVKTEIQFKEIDAFIAQVKKAAEGNEQEFVRFLGNPKFEERFDTQRRLLSLNSQWMLYELSTHPVENESIRKRYRDFSNWYAKLNCMAQPLSLPPFARLVVNEHLDRLKQIPIQVRLTIRLDREIRVRSEHKVEWKIAPTDAARIRAADEQFAQFRTVTFAEFHQQALQAEKPGETKSR